MDKFTNNRPVRDDYREGPDYYAMGERCDRMRKHSAQMSRRARRLEMLRNIVLMFVVGFIIGFVMYKYQSYKTEAARYQNQPVIEQTVPEAAAPEVQAPEQVAEPEVVPDADTGDAPVTPEHEAPAANWRESSKTHDISPNLLIKYDDSHVIMNFNDCAAVGASLSSKVITTSEADYGFELTVLDADSVKVRVYNNTDEYIKAEAAYVDLASGTHELTADANGDYIISGYKDCPNGLGDVVVLFSNKQILSMGVFKENDVLYAVNIQDTDAAIRVVDTRTNIQTLLDKAGITEKDAVYTDPIYYPIVPANSSETTDTAYWLAKSDELVEPDWSDARKIETFYNYIIDNMAYDRWIVKQKQHGRCFYYNDYSGKYHISNTRIGVCEDFTQIMAIMCRAQGIPALNTASESHSHSIVIVYSKDYNRWIPIDTTADISHDAWDEDFSVWVASDSPRYKNFDSLKAMTFDHVYIGNPKDMQNNGIPTTY